MTKPKSKCNPKLELASSPTTNKPKVGRPKKSTNDGAIGLSKQLAAKKSRYTRTSGPTTQVSPQNKRKVQSSEFSQAPCVSSGEPLPKCRRLLFTAEENKENVLNSVPKQQDTDTSSIVNNNLNKSCSEQRSFSPIPSTSTDIKTIQENEKRFNESFDDKNIGGSKKKPDFIKKSDSQSDKLENVLIDSDEENTPIKTSKTKFYPNIKNDSDCIILDDSISGSAPKFDKYISHAPFNNDIEIIEIPCETITIDDCPNSSTPYSLPNIKKNIRSSSPVVVVDDYDSCIDINLTPDINDDDIVDIDALMAYNETCLEKYRKEDVKLNAVTYVEAKSISEGQSTIPQAGTSLSTDVVKIEVSTEQTNETYMRRSQQPDNVDSVAGIIHNFFEQSSSQLANNNNDLTGTNENINTPQATENSDLITEFANNTSDNRISENSSTAEIIHVNDSIPQTAHNNSSVAEIINDFFMDYNNRLQSAQIQHNVQDTNQNNNSVVEINDSIENSPMSTRHNDSSIIEIINNASVNASSRQRQNRRQKLLRDSLRVLQEAERLLQLRSHYPQGSGHVSRNIRQVDPPSMIANRNTVRVNPPMMPGGTPVASSLNTIDPPGMSEPFPPKSVGGIGECPICMENMSGSAIASTLCGHVFCLNCIRKSISINGKKCPTCRKALKGVGYHQLFL